MIANIIIVVVLVFIIAIGIGPGIKHFKGEGGCCGGGSTVKVKKKKLKNVIGQRICTVEGMTCDHCKARVESRLNALDGVSAKVNLKKKTAVVSMERPVSDDELREAVRKAGYTITDIR